MKRKQILCLTLVLAMCLSLFGCGPQLIDIATETSAVTVRSRIIDGIPVVRYFKNDGKKKPVVFSLHGYGGSKSNHAHHCQQLAEMGYYAVTLDAYGHGGRTGGELKNFAQVVSQYPKDIDIVVNSLKQDPQADLDNMVMMGVSMGGMAAYMYATNAEIKPIALMPIITTPDIAQLVDTELSRTTYDAKLGKGISAMPQEEINQILIDNSTYKDHANLKDIAVFMQHGDADPLVPMTGSQRLYDDLTALDARLVQLRIYPGLGHWAYDNYWQEANKYLNLLFFLKKEK